MPSFSASSNNLLKEFCNSIGMTGLELDEEGQRSLSFDDKVILSFIGDDREGLTAVCYIGDLTKDEDMRVFLEQNFIAESHGGARFGLEPHTNRVTLAGRWDASRISVSQFSNLLEVMVNSALKAQEFLNQGGVSAKASAANSDQVGEAAPANVAGSLAAYEHQF